MSLYEIVELPAILLEDKSKLFVGEYFLTLPFEVKRLFMLYDFHKDNMRRGDHAHYECKQLLFCLQGAYTLKIDNAYTTISLKQNSKEPNKGVFIDSLTWVELLEIEKNSRILVLASHKYKESDYIRDYSKYKQIIRGTE